MKLEKICELTRKTAEAEDTKQESRTKASYFTRTRKMSFSDLVYYILHPGKESTNLGIKRFFAMIGKEGCRMSEQAFSKARSHFSHWPFEKMVRETTKEEYSGADVRTWNGYHLFAVDGTTVALPDKAALCEVFGGSGRKKDSATARASILYDIENDWIADAALDPYPTVERTQAMRHILRLKELGLASQSLVLFDRGYPEAKFLAFLQANGIRFLMRCKRKWNPVVDETQCDDFRMELNQDVSLRVVRVILPSGETETLITNLFDLPHEQFMPLYFRRWPVETKYDILKNKLELCNFTGCSPNAIRQDFWASIHLANIAAVAKAEADQSILASRVGSENKYTYQANTAQLIGTLKDRFIRACFLQGDRRSRAIQNIIDEIALAVSPVRPNRSFRRNPWPRKAKFCFNRRSNI